MLFPFLGFSKKKYVENPKGQSTQKESKKKKRVRELARLKTRKGSLGKN